MKTLAIVIGFLPNPRIYKRISLEKEHYNVHLICWDRGSDMQKSPTENGYSVYCISEKASSDPLKRIGPYRRFSKAAFEELKRISPDIIHVQGIDMLNIACTYKNKVNNSTHIIYEVADLHRLLIDKQRNIIRKVAQCYLRSLDKKRCKEIDLLIVTSEKYIEKYFYAIVPEEKTFVFPNVPDLSAFTNYAKKADRENFTVGFIGDIRYPNQMINLIEAAKACDLNVLFAGFEQGGNKVEALCNAYKRGKWYGRFDFKKEVSALYGMCDVVYSVYDADMENVRVAIPNKLYESIFCGLPIIVARNTYLSEIVENWQVGLSVDHKNIEELKKVLLELSSNRELYDTLSSNCKAHRKDVNLTLYNDKLRKILCSLASCES